MNEKQSFVVATGVAFLIIATVFFVPWRLASTGEIKWSPIYRQPMSYISTNDRDPGDSRYVYDKADIAAGILLLEVFGILVVSGGLYYFLKDRSIGNISSNGQQVL